MIAPVVWQHHLLSVYHVEVDGDDAKALVYHTSHQLFEDDPDSAKLLVGRYHNELRREQPTAGRSPSSCSSCCGARRRSTSPATSRSIGGRGPIR